VAAVAKVIALFPAHPAQLWLMLAVQSWIKRNDSSIEFRWFFRDKDVTLSLARSLGLEGVVVSRASSGLVGNAIELLTNVVRCLYYTKKYNIDLWLTKYGCGNIAAKILGIKNISFNDDDEDVVPLIAKTSYPFADMLLFPKFTRNSRFPEKTIYYNGLHELAYLNTDREKNDRLSDNVCNQYSLIRISALKSHHDVGHSGISIDFLDKLISEFRQRNIRVYISSESKLPQRFSSMVRKADVSEIHDFLQGACFYVGDSQTMAIEACLLSVPTLRISDFDKISVINHLESQGLIMSFSPGDLSSLKFLHSFLNNYEENYALFRERVRNAVSSYDDTREVFGKAVLKLLRG
jgi:hypothetical protein